MSTFATSAAEFAGVDYDSGAELRVIRVSTDLAHPRVGLDVETDETYDRTVLTAADARLLAAELNRCADLSERSRRV